MIETILVCGISLKVESFCNRLEVQLACCYVIDVPGSSPVYCSEKRRVRIPKTKLRQQLLTRYPDYVQAIWAYAWYEYSASLKHLYQSVDICGYIYLYLFYLIYSIGGYLKHQANQIRGCCHCQVRDTQLSGNMRCHVNSFGLVWSFHLVQFF